MRLANISNGLVYPHDGVCAFQSQHGHRYSTGYFRADAMPYDIVIHLLRGGQITIVDATRRHKPLTDALRWGVPAWLRTFNRAVDQPIRVCSWETAELRRLDTADIHHSTRQMIRRLARYYGKPAPLEIGNQVLLECHHGAIWDDKPKRLASIIHEMRL